MAFNDRRYTEDSIIKQLGLIELHGKDGSAVDAGCACIETKHLYLLEGLAEEGIGFAVSAKERQFYQDLSNFMRETRKRMEVEDYNLHGVMRKVMERKNPVPQIRSSSRMVLSNGLIKCKRKYSDDERKLTRCIEKLKQ